MIRTQIYIAKENHDRLIRVARIRKEAVAKLIRDFIEAGLEKNPGDHSGKQALNEVAKLKLKGGPKDLSKNLDHYLYGGSKK